MLTVSLVLCVLVLGSQAVSYDDWGICNYGFYFDYENNLSDLLRQPYVHSVTKLPGYEQIDGIVVKASMDDPASRPDGVMFKAMVYNTNGSVYDVKYSNEQTTTYAIQETYVLPNGKELYAFVFKLETISECNVSILYRCSFKGKNALDIINVVKKEKVPLSDECEDKIAQLYASKGLLVSPLIKLPYQLNNYDTK